jgi:hypothetical protein
MEARLPPEKTMAKCHRGFQPKLKSPIREILELLVRRQANWQAQGNNCDHCYVGQGGDVTENPAPSFPRRLRIRLLQNHWQAILHFTVRVH